MWELLWLIIGGLVVAVLVMAFKIANLQKSQPIQPQRTDNDEFAGLLRQANEELKRSVTNEIWTVQYLKAKMLLLDTLYGDGFNKLWDKPDELKKQISLALNGIATAHLPKLIAGLRQMADEDDIKTPGRATFWSLAILVHMSEIPLRMAKNPTDMVQATLNQKIAIDLFVDGMPA